MSLLKELEASATVAWSPISSKSNLLALGSKEGVGVGFDNYGGELQVVSMDFGDTSPNTTVLGSIKTSSRFMSLCWSEVLKHPACSYGLIAGGMSDGGVYVWDPLKIVKGEETAAQVCRIQRHKGAVNAIQFNPHKDSTHLFASGGSDNEIYISSMENLAQPAVFSPGGPSSVKHTSEITCLSWNPQVSYILASGSQNGSTMVWDLKQKKPWCELKDPQRGIVSAIAWNPNEGHHLITASDDDQKPVLRLWDLRSSTSTPLSELNSHTAGILSVAWCPSDSGLLMSCAKDNRTLLWDLYTGQPIYELPSRSNVQPGSSSSGQFFGGSAGGQRRFNVQWSTKIPAVVSACTFDGKVQVWGMAGAGSATSVRAPKWYRRPVTASFGFSGKLVSVNNSKSKVVNVHRVVSEPELVANATRLESAMTEKNFHDYCSEKINSCSSQHQKNIWAFMQILFEKDARQQLLLHLGFNAEDVALEAAKYTGNSTEVQSTEIQSPEVQSNAPMVAGTLTSPKGFGLDDDDFLEGINTTSQDAADEDTVVDSTCRNLDNLSLKPEKRVPPQHSQETEDMIKRALLVGDFEVAVDCCLKNNQLADALLLATCGGPELWTRTQEAYFSRQTRPYMKIVSAIIKSELSTLVAESDLEQWQETLAILSTYGKSEEFPALCDALAARLESIGDIRSATLCYMCAVNVGKTVGIWVNEAAEQHHVMGDTLPLLELVEKVSVFRQALEPPEQDMGSEVASQFSAYAALLASQGLLDIASRYLVDHDISCAIMRDRIFHAAPPKGIAPPPSPFERHDVVVAGNHGQHQQRQQQQQQQQRIPTQTQPQRQPTNYGGYGQHSFAQQAHPTQTPHTAYPGQQSQVPNGNFGVSNPALQQQPPPPQQQQTTFQNHPPQQQQQQQQQQNTFQQGGQPGYRGQVPTATTTTPSIPNPISSQTMQSPFPGQVNEGYANPTPPSNTLPNPTHNPSSNANPTPAFPGQSGHAFPSAGTYNLPQPTQSFSNPPPPPPQNQGGFAATSPVPTPNYPIPSQNYASQAASGGSYSTGNPSASPGVPGLNPVEAALKTSSKLAKTPVNMQQQRSDGFVSSVGDKNLALKYGNTPSTPLSPVASQPTPVTPQAIPGSIDSVAPENMPIVHSFNEIVSLLESNPNLTTPEKRQFAEICKAKETLFTKLNGNEISPSVIEKLHEMIQSFSNRDFRAAQQLHVALTTTDWAEHKDWLRGVKALITISAKRLS